MEKQIKTEKRKRLQGCAAGILFAAVSAWKLYWGIHAGFSVTALISVLIMAFLMILCFIDKRGIWPVIGFGALAVEELVEMLERLIGYQYFSLSQLLLFAAAVGMCCLAAAAAFSLADGKFSELAEELWIVPSAWSLLSAIMLLPNSARWELLVVTQGFTPIELVSMYGTNFVLAAACLLAAMWLGYPKKLPANSAEEPQQPVPEDADTSTET